MAHSKLSINGFTLVELAIVLAITGLLVGGILGGQALQTSSRNRRVVTDASEYAIAVSNFKDKYAYLPGDLPTAVQLWGKADGDTNLTTNCAAPTTDNAVVSGTCNGDGNGLWGISTGEPYRAWQQLALAGLINGKYTGVSNTAGSRDSVAGVNVPLGIFDNTGYSFDQLGEVTGGSNSAYYDGDYKNVMVYGAQVSGYITRNPAITGEAAFEIDTKLDDGLPALGNVRTYKSLGSGIPMCPSGTTTASTYNVAQSGASCSLIFMQTFKKKPQG